MPFDATPYYEPEPPRDPILNILIGTRVLLSKPGGWTRLALARNAARKNCELDDPSAVAFCCWGAIQRVSGNVYDRKAAVFALGFADYAGVINFNDSCRGRAPILTRLDKGIAKRQLELQITETTNAV